MKQPITGRSVHNVVLTDSESAVLKHIITETLREINDFEKELKIAENKVWSNCNPFSNDITSVVSFKGLNLIRDTKRKIQKRKYRLERIQRALRSSLNHAF